MQLPSALLRLISKKKKKKKKHPPQKFLIFQEKEFSDSKNKKLTFSKESFSYILRNGTLHF